MVNVSLLQGAIIVGIILGIGVCVVILYLLLKRFMQKKREQFIETYFRKYLDAWYDYLVLGKENVSLTLSHRKSYMTFLAVDRIFSHYVTTIKNENVIARIGHYAEVHFLKQYKDMLKSDNWGIRMNALYRIFHYDLTFLVDDVRTYLKKGRFQNFEDYSLMLKIMAKYDETLVISHLLKPKLPLQQYEYKHIVFYLPQHYFERLINHYDDMPQPLKISLLEYFSYKPDMEPQFLHFYEGQLQSEDPEIRIRALKAIHKFGLITDISLYEPFMTSPLWEERMLFTRIVTSSDLHYATDKLRQLICDPSWWVRKRAAYALFHLKNGQQILHDIIAEGKDPYAVEAAKEILKVE